MTPHNTHGIFAPRLHTKLKNWASDKRGLAAVEFALIAAPFFFLIFGLLEICVIFIMSTTLEHGLNEAARGIRTGAYQEAGFSQIAFRQQICDNMLGLLNCDDRLYTDVKTFDSFGDTNNPDPIDPVTRDLDDSDFGYDPGEANDIVVVRAFYEWNLFTPVLSAPLSNLSGGRHLLQATVAFRNEPFGS